MQDNSKKLKDGFEEAMRNSILSGRLRPGDRLPPERSLAAEFGISRGSVNQGILDLERAGFLRVVPRKGTFVAEYMRNATPLTMSAVMSYDSASVDGSLFKDLMDMRILVERECVRLACGRINRRSVSELRAAEQAIFSASESGPADALYAYHRCVIAIAGNAAYLMIFQSFEKMLRNMIQTHYSSRAETERSLPLYDELTEAICAGNADKADECILAILASASEYLNEKLRRGETE